MCRNILFLFTFVIAAMTQYCVFEIPAVLSQAHWLHWLHWLAWLKTLKITYSCLPEHKPLRSPSEIILWLWPFGAHFQYRRTVVYWSLPRHSNLLGFTGAGCSKSNSSRSGLITVSVMKLPVLGQGLCGCRDILFVFGQKACPLSTQLCHAINHTRQSIASG